ALGALAWARRTANPAIDTSAKADVPVLALEFAPSDMALVQRLPMVRTMSISGSLARLTQAIVKAPVAGEVRRVLVREGESVRLGAVVAEIDTTDARARLDAVLADQAERRARLAVAQRNRDTNLALLQQSFISQNAFDQLQSGYEAAQASVQGADAQVKLMRKAIDDAVVRAPIAGQVSKRWIQGGERVGPDAPIISLVDLSRLELEATVPASEVARIAIGQAVRFRVDGFGARSFDGRVERINPVAEISSRAIKVAVSVPNVDGSLRGGMFAQGSVTLSQTDALPVIPASAVFEEAGQAYVFTVEEAKLAKRGVRLGLKDEVSGLVELVQGPALATPVVRIRMNGLKVGAPAVLVKAPADQRPAATP
ncbi:MAG: efflux RND transporter periplasmic adaptor subunit, partial [Rhodoferax sp.]|nr:efflux RND transporter periplasmic adaptor subunit [Rhodoferax sp.]